MGVESHILPALRGGTLLIPGAKVLRISPEDLEEAQEMTGKKI
jgi:hypothetical protein